MAKTTRKKAAKRPTGAKSEPPSVRREDIALRAWEIFQRRGEAHGGDIDDWLQAEHELQEEAEKQKRALHD